MRFFKNTKEKINNKCSYAWTYLNENILTTTKRQIVALLIMTLSVNALLSFALLNAKETTSGWSGVPQEVVDHAKNNETGAVEYVYYDTPENSSADDRVSPFNGLLYKPGDKDKPSPDEFVHIYADFTASEDVQFASITAAMGKNARKYDTASGRSTLKHVILWNKDGKGYQFTFTAPSSDSDGKIGVGTRASIHKEKSDNDAIALVSKNAQKDKDFDESLSELVSEEMKQASTEHDKGKAEEILEDIISWGLNVATTFIEEGIGDFTDSFKIGSPLFEEVFSTIKAASSGRYSNYTALSVFAVALSWSGYAILVFIAFLSIIITITSPTAQETPFQILGGTAIATVLTINAHRFFEIFESIGVQIQKMFFAGDQSLTNLDGWKSLVQDTNTSHSDGIVSTIMMLIASILLIKEIFALILEIAERYGVYKLFYYTSPVFCATSASGITRGIFSTYIKTLVSHLFIMIMNLWVVGLAGSLLRQTPQNTPGINNGTNSRWILYVMFVLMILRIGRKLDDYLGSMGLSVARTGGNLAGAVVGAVAAGRMLASGARTAAHVAGTAGAAGAAVGKDVATGKAGDRLRHAASLLDNKGSQESKAMKAMDSRLAKEAKDAAHKGQVLPPVNDDITFGMAKKHGRQIGGAGLEHAFQHSMKDPTNFTGPQALNLKNAVMGANGLNIDKQNSGFDAVKGTGKVSLVDQKGTSMGSYDLNTRGEGFKVDDGVYATVSKGAYIGTPHAALQAIGDDGGISIGELNRHEFGQMQVDRKGISETINSICPDANIEDTDIIRRYENGYAIFERDGDDVGEIKGILREGASAGDYSFTDDRGASYSFRINDGNLDIHDQTRIVNTKSDRKRR